jgi:peptide deformylase
LTSPVRVSIVLLIESRGKVGEIMSVLPILRYPDPRLKRVSAPVDRIDRDIRALVEDMVQTMYAAPGVGLAAPQVGRLLRVIVVDVSAHEAGAEPLALVNPQILQAEGEITWEEGCLSVPDLLVEIPRKERLVLSGLDPSGRQVEVEGSGLLAVAIQHEMDHLDGRLIIDRVSHLRRELYRKRQLKAASQVGG